MRVRTSVAACRARADQGARRRRHKIGLGPQDEPVVEDLQSVGGERRSRGGDVDHQLGRSSTGRAFRRTEAFDDPVIGNALLGKEPAGEIHVFGGNPHLAAVARAKIGRDLIEIGHSANVDPRLGHRHDDVGVAEAKRRQHLDRFLRIRNLLADQVLASDAEMGRPRWRAD